MKHNYTLLLVGNPYDGHFLRFVKYIHQGNPSAIIDVFGINQNGKCVSSDYNTIVRNIYLFDCDKKLAKFPILRNLEFIHKLRKYFRSNVAKEKYDIVNIHAPLYYHSFLLNDIKSVTKYLVLTPWGSDVYRISNMERRIVKKLYDASNIVTGSYGLRFTQDVMRIYNIPETKMRNVTLFGDQIDYYMEHKDAISVEQAKNNFGIKEDSYVITCGYNASLGQRHMEIIDAIDKAKTNLPTNIVLLFPFTYGGSNEYKESVKKRVQELGFKGVYCETYLNLESLLKLRLATDMFIHIQTTDANNGSLKEYLYFDKNVINGGWLRYDDIEENDYRPYHVTPTVDDLSKVIERAYRQGPVPLRKRVKETIEYYSYHNLVPKWIELFMSLVD